MKRKVHDDLYDWLITQPVEWISARDVSERWGRSLEKMRHQLSTLRREHRCEYRARTKSTGFGHYRVILDAPIPKRLTEVEPPPPPPPPPPQYSITTPPPSDPKSPRWRRWARRTARAMATAPWRVEASILPPEREPEDYTPEIPTERECRACGETKPLNGDNFHVNPKYLHGFRTECIPCHRKRCAAYGRRKRAEKGSAA